MFLWVSIVRMNHCPDFGLPVPVSSISQGKEETPSPAARMSTYLSNATLYIYHKTVM
jgi:hypothetical protein